MAYTAQNSRDFLALARMLRDYAQRHPGEENNALFLSTAEVLEGQARLAASTAGRVANGVRARAFASSDTLHDPINVVI